MTGLVSTEAQERVSLGASTLASSHLMLSQQSSELDYEIAQQLVQHSQEARDGSRGSFITSVNDLRASPTAAIDETDNNGGPITNDHEHEVQKRQSPPRSPLQDRPREGQYAPLTNAPAMGQVCR